VILTHRKLQPTAVKVKLLTVARIIYNIVYSDSIATHDGRNSLMSSTVKFGII